MGKRWKEGSKVLISVVGLIAWSQLRVMAFEGKRLKKIELRWKGEVNLGWGIDLS